MATKAQVVKALEKHAPGAKVIDNKPPFGHDVELEAPEGHHWGGDVHCRCVGAWYSGPKAEYWDTVLEVIAELPPAVPCADDDCEGIAAWGECEYWEAAA
jgi:hypothetical protein